MNIIASKDAYTVTLNPLGFNGTHYIKKAKPF